MSSEPVTWNDADLTSVTRTTKQNDRDHIGLANGAAASEEHHPRHFPKSGFVASDPRKIKKEGGGKGNW